MAIRKVIGLRRVSRQSYAGRLTKAMDKAMRSKGRMVKPKKVSPKRVYY
jgi:hypothetical protein